MLLLAMQLVVGKKITFSVIKTSIKVAVHVTMIMTTENNRSHYFQLAPCCNKVMSSIRATVILAL